MPYQEVTEPIPGPEAFHATGDAATLSQAAVLLMLGTQLRGDDYALYGRAAAAGLQPFMEAIPRDDLERFPVPRVPAIGERISFERVRFLLVDRFGAYLLPAITAVVPAPPLDLPSDSTADLAQQLYTEPTPLIAAQLLEIYLRHPDPLLRVAAASSYYTLSAEPSRMLPVLVDGTESNDPLTRTVAATALARVAPTHPRLAELTQSAPPGAGGAPSHSSLLIHGTFAASSAWWQPGGDFHRYLRATVRPDLYDQADRFGWSGGYSNAARAIAADELHAWISRHDWNRPDLFTHSHSGSVAMLASHQDGLNFGEVVLLSCPVHVHQYMPDFNSVWKVVSIRVHLDLVILADGGGQRFWHPKIQENVLPVWFDHFATHQPEIWQEYTVPAML